MENNERNKAIKSFMAVLEPIQKRLIRKYGKSKVDRWNNERWERYASKSEEDFEAQMR